MRDAYNSERMRRFLLALALSLPLGAQDPPVPSAPKPLVFAGSPIVLEPRCRSNDLAELGLSCSSHDPCVIYLEIASIEAVGDRLVLAGNLHTSSVTVESVLLVSEDGGANWTEPSSRISAATLDQIQFLDFEYGWISGQVMAALARDAFFLLSRDGGKTWRRQNVFSEPRVGAIESYWFTARNGGLMAIDRLQSAENGMRYELYESQTGGENWSLRQMAEKPIPINRPAKGEPSVRAHPDPSGKHYRIERNSGSDWVLVSSFAIRAADCSPTPPEPQPEAPAP
jgi:hypothetical protein